LFKVTQLLSYKQKQGTVKFYQNSNLALTCWSWFKSRRYRTLSLSKRYSKRFGITLRWTQGPI